MVRQMRNCFRIWFMKRWLHRFHDARSPDSRSMVISSVWMPKAPVGADARRMVWLTPRSKGASQMVVSIRYPRPRFVSYADRLAPCVKNVPIELSV